MGTLHHVEKRLDQASNTVDSTTFSTITDGSTTLEILPSQLNPTRDYLVLAQTNLKSASTSNDALCRLVQVNESGVFQSEFDGSRQSVEISEAGDAENYFWFTTYRFETGANGVALQIARDSAAGAITAYHSTIIVLDITEREWFFDEDSTDTTLTDSFSTANNPSVAFTPNTGQDWLLLFTQTFDMDAGTSSSVEVRADFTDVPNKIYSKREGEKTTNKYILSWARPYNFASPVAQTVKVDARTTDASQQHTRTYSAVFAMSLSAGTIPAFQFNFAKFDYKSSPSLNNTTFYGDMGAEIDWQSGDYAGSEDVIILSMARETPLGTNRSIRLGVDNGSGTYYRTGTFSDAQPIGNPKDFTDHFPVFDLFLSNINGAAKQWDARVSVDHSSCIITDRFILALSTSGHHRWDASTKIVFTIDEKSLWSESELDTLDNNAANRIKDKWNAEMTTSPTFTVDAREHNSFFNIGTLQLNWELYPKVICHANNEPDATLSEVLQAFVTDWVALKDDLEAEVQGIRATTNLTSYRYSDEDGNRILGGL